MNSEEIKVEIPAVQADFIPYIRMQTTPADAAKLCHYLRIAATIKRDTTFRDGSSSFERPRLPKLLRHLRSNNYEKLNNAWKRSNKAQKHNDPSYEAITAAA